MPMIADSQQNPSDRMMFGLDVMLNYRFKSFINSQSMELNCCCLINFSSYDLLIFFLYTRVR
jgi:hypothetical protein